MIKKVDLLIAFALLISVILPGCSGEKKNQEIFDEFEGEEGIYMIKLPPGLFLGMLSMGDGCDIDPSDIGDIDMVKVMIFDQNKAANRTSGELIDEIKGKFDKFGYEMIIQLNSSGSDISAYILENGEDVTDLMVLVNEGSTMIGMGLSGKLDARSIMKFASEVDYEQFRGFIN